MSSYYEKILATGEVKCIDEEIPFEIPQGWEWERWGNISQSIQYGYNAPALEHGAIKMVRISDIQENCVLWDNVPYCQIAENDIDTYLLKVNDILFARTGGTVGKSFLVEEVPERAIYAGYLIRTRYSSLLNPRYMKSFMESQLYWEQLKNGTIATAQPNCNGKTLAKMLLPIPPAKEQDRIVGKLTQLSPFLNNYTQCQERLNLLNEEIKEQLKKSILQEAIQGKLVPQLAAEGTAQELLDLIKAEKQKLVKEGKLKKSALNDSIIFRGDDNRYYEKIGKKIVCIEDEVPFEIPNSWVWARLGAIVDFSKSQTISSSMLDMDSWILDLEDIEKDSGRLLQKKRMKDLLSKSDKHLFYKGNVLYSKLRPYLNKVIVADEDGACTTEILAFDFGHIYNKYAQAYLMSHFFVDYANSDSYGIKMPRLGSKRGNNALFPLPPFKEQQRIVAQIEKLFEQLH